ncbi:MAG: division/cell wall cluster transcriptional repressor MraZ [Propionibacteriaceae bacterium]|jgi:MraZ protein|nr:division/cell wall cluster transcriptional repressor MraZ [Propionibacteriaceae bacterium]
MFLGSFTPKLDEKGRFFLPTKFREQLSRGMVISRQPERCLAIWPVDAFQAEVEAAATGRSTDENSRLMQRMFASGASDESADSQGRVTVPSVLRNYAGLDKEIAVIGAYTHVEVWNPAAWEEYQANKEEYFAQVNNGGNKE